MPVGATLADVLRNARQKHFGLEPDRAACAEAITRVSRMVDADRGWQTKSLSFLR